MNDIHLPNPDVMLIKHKRYRSHPLPEDVYVVKDSLADFSL
ncbi:MAG: hypothetical protein ACRCYY_18235 [Trueperaceae bacterium]